MLFKKNLNDRFLLFFSLFLSQGFRRYKIEPETPNCKYFGPFLNMNGTLMLSRH